MSTHQFCNFLMGGTSAHQGKIFRSRLLSRSEPETKASASSARPQEFFGIKKILGFLETAGDFFGVLLPVLGAGLVTHCCLSSFGHRNCSAHWPCSAPLALGPRIGENMSESGRRSLDSTPESHKGFLQTMKSH